MEDWTDIIKERLQEAKEPLPPGDWEAFEASLPVKRPGVLHWLVPSLVAAAAAALFFFWKPVPQPETALPESPVASIERFEPDVPVTVAEAIPPATAPAVSKPVPPAEEISKEPVPQERQDARTEIEEKPLEEKPVIQEEEEPWDDAVEQEKSPVTKPSRRFTVTAQINGPGSRSFFRSGDLVAVSSQNYVSTLDAQYTGLNSAFEMLGSWTVHHSVPLSFGLEISYFPISRLALTSGLEFSLYRSSFTTPAGVDNSVRQRAYYLGIPIKAEWVAWQGGRFSAWLGAGGKVDRCIGARRDHTRIRDDAFNWSVMADASLEYALTKNLGLYIQPEVSWFFKPSDPVLQTYRTEHPLMVTVGAGLRIGF